MPRSMKAMLVVFAVIVGTIFLWLAKPAHAQGICGKRSDFLAAIMGEKYHEEKNGAGIAGEVALIQIYASKSGGTFTVLMTMPNGQTCIIAAGKDWIVIVPQISGDKT